MKIENVGVMSPGDMGQAVALQIKAKGLHVYTALEHRSERTRGLAREAGLTDVGTLAQLVVECDVVLSIMDPGAAVDFAREVSDAIRTSGRRTLIVDCNAIAPQTVYEIATLVEQAGGRFLDAGIIGPPPRGTAKTNLYVSGPGASDLEQLAGPQLLVHPIGERVADASALKMCYGALNKGTQALWLEVLIAAERLGIAGLLEQQLQHSQADRYSWALSQFPELTPKGQPTSIASLPAHHLVKRPRKTAIKRGRARMWCDCWLIYEADVCSGSTAEAMRFNRDVRSSFNTYIA